MTPTQNISHIITSLTQTYNILQHYKAKKNTIFNNGCYTTNITTDPHTITTTYITTSMCHIHTSIVSMHLATRGNNQILRTPPPHISSSEEILPRLTRRTLAKTVTHTTHVISLQLHLHTHHVVIAGGFVDRPLRREDTAGQMDGEAGCWTTNGKIRIPY